MIMLWFLAFVVALTFLIRAGIQAMGRRAGRQVAEKHKDAESIIDTGSPPEHWPASDDRLARLDELIGYFRTSPMVADEPTREYLLNELRRVRREWEEKL